MVESTFTNSLNNYIGQTIGIYKIDGDYIEGTVYYVKDNFLALKDSDGNTTFLNVDLILAITKDTKDFNRSEIDEEMMEPLNFMELMNQHVLKWVKISGQNNLSFEGILSATGEDHLVITKKNVQYTIQASHIHQLVTDFRQTENNSSEENESEENSNEENSNDANNEQENNNAQQNQTSNNSSSKGKNYRRATLVSLFNMMGTTNQ